jgi:hypothetical protein
MPGHQRLGLRLIGGGDYGFPGRGSWFAIAGGGRLQILAGGIEPGLPFFEPCNTGDEGLEGEGVLRFYAEAGGGVRRGMVFVVGEGFAQLGVLGLEALDFVQAFRETSAGYPTAEGAKIAKVG